MVLRSVGPKTELGICGECLQRKLQGKGKDDEENRQAWE